MASSPKDLQSQRDLLRSLHHPGVPLLLPNVWDVATARAEVAAGFPVVATTSGDVAAVGVARVSWGPFLHLDVMARFEEQLASLQK